MGKRDLKEQNKDLEIHVVDLINKFDPSETGKYTGFLTKILKDKIAERENEKHVKKGRLRTLNIDSEFKMPKGTNDLEEVLIHYLSELYSRENMETLIRFHQHVKENRIIGKDINSYKGWDEINKEVSLATLKQTQKLLEKEVQKVVEIDEWLVIRPLTMEASLTYGAGTKWCTSMRHNKDYFYRYSRNGVLCYVINKLDGDKYGLFYDMESNEFSIWNAPDRRIDSVESTIPSDLMSKLYKFMKTEKSNYDYFSESEKEKCSNYMDLKEVAAMEEEPTDEEATVIDMPDYDDMDALTLFEEIEDEGPNITSPVFLERFYLEQALRNYEGQTPNRT
jgi:hypothetical protein